MNKYIIGLDVGGTKIAAGAVDSRGKVVKRITLPTEARRGRKIILKNILTAASKVWLPGTSAIGLAMAGQCDTHRGIFLSGENFPKNFKNINLRKILEKNFHVPVYLDNDARAFTLAEATSGAGRGFKNVLGITFGTGIGGGIVMNGQLIRGKDNAAGELGHMTLNAASPYRCSCGNIGHFEALASCTAMINMYKKMTGRTFDTFEIEKRYKKGEPAAKKVFTMISNTLALGLANLTHLLNPDVIVFGGGLSRIPALWPPALREFKKRVIYKSLQKTKIVKAKLKNDAGIIGATLIKP